MSQSDQPIHLKIVESLASNYKLEEFVKDNPGNDNVDIMISRIFYGFEITTSDGIKYTFGKTNNSIEFSGTSTRSEEVHGNNNYIATTWYLTKIETPDNEITTFEYLRNNTAVFKQSTTLSVSESENLLQGSSQSSLKNDHVSIHFLTYLNKITFDKGEILFNKYLSNELKYPLYEVAFEAWGNDELDKNYSDAGLFDHYTDNNNNHWYKLDDIIVKDKSGKRIKKIEFNYTNNSSSRLFLNEIEEFGEEEFGTTDKSFGKIHGFEYDQTPLPPYNSQKIDHWGYYNGQYFAGELSGGTVPGYSHIPQYYNSRESDFSFAQAGILKKINYPTGGYTLFIYEPNTYSQIATKSETSDYFSPISASETKTGGVRIQEIISNATDPLSPPVSKNYFYVNDYATSGVNSISSGILNGLPNYLEEGPSYDGVQNYWFWNSYAVEAMSSTSGSHVTYSKVIEKSSGTNGYIEYTYTNHQQGYLDKKAYQYVIWSAEQWKNCPFIDYSFIRGKLLSEKYYNSDNSLVKEIINYYDSVQDIDDNTVRALFYNTRQFGHAKQLGPFTDLNGVTIGRMMALFEIPVFFHYLKQTEEITYDTNGVGPVKSTTEFTYSPERLKNTIKTTSSIGGEVETNISYVSDFVTSYPENWESETSDRQVIEKMSSLNMINYPIEVVKNSGSDSYESSFYEYGFHEGNIKLSNISKLKLLSSQNFVKADYANSSSDDIIKNNDYYKDVTIHEYDNKGNPIEVSKENGIHTVYIWGYYGTELIAKIENANYNDVYNPTVNVENIQSKSDLDIDASSELILKNTLEDLRNQPTLSSAMITTYTYDQLIGVTSITDPKGNTNFYSYDGLNRLEFITNNDEDIVQKYSYNYNYNTTSKFSLSDYTHNFLATGDSKSIFVTSDRNWTVSESAIWLSITGGTGSGNGSFDVVADPNLATSDRAASVTITFDDGSALELKITQNEAFNFTLTKGTRHSLQSGSYYNTTISNTSLVDYYYALGTSDDIQIHATVTSNEPDVDPVTYTVVYDGSASGWLDVSYFSPGKTISFEAEDPEIGTTVSYASINVTSHGITRIISVKFDPNVQ